MLTIPANDTVVKIGKLQDYFSCARINGRSIGSCLIVFWPRAGLLGLTARLEGRESNIRNLKRSLPSQRLFLPLEKKGSTPTFWSETFASSIRDEMCREKKRGVRF